MSRNTARQREETPVCAMCLEPYAVPSPGETIFSCTACSAVLHGECYKRFKEADRQRAQARYEAQIEAHQASRPDALCSPQVFHIPALDSLSGRHPPRTVNSISRRTGLER